jgi:DNA polymerase III epsilon subunit family exonuclease
MDRKSLKKIKKIAEEFRGGKIFVAFDTETTGLQKECGSIIEIGAVKFNADGILGEPFDALLKPPVCIPPFVEKLTGITNQSVCSCPTASEILPEFMKFLGGEKTILVAHNANFDMGFLNAELGRLGMESVKNSVVDTLKSAICLYPEFRGESEKGQYKLQNLAKRFGIEVFAAHRASDDARVCMELFKRIVFDSENKIVEEKSGVQF